MKATKKHLRRTLRRICTVVMFVLTAALCFAVGYYRGSARIPAAAAETTHVCSVRYYINGELEETEGVNAGGRAGGIGFPEKGGERVLCWLDDNGRETDPVGMTVYTDMRFNALMGPLIRAEPGYFPRTEEFFRPEAPLLRGEAAEILYGLLSVKPEAAVSLTDVDENAPCRESASALVAAGLMDAPAGVFSPDSAMNEADFSRLLSSFFRSSDVADAMERIAALGGETVTRAEAAVVLNTLLGLDGGEREIYLPDVERGYWAFDAVSLAAQGSSGGPLPEGFVNLDGYLYCIGENGFAVKNTFVGSLFFDGNGRYTSGSTELDDYVAAHIREYTAPDMEREEMLRAMYNHVRDDFTYLRRNYYQVSDINWAMKEALTMYASGQGNCYCYAAAFWAAARGLGFDASTVSGTIGSERSPHGWVIISMDGGHYVFDVEIEMAYHRDGMKHIDNFKVEHGAAVARWLYVELYNYNQAVPRQREMGFELH